MCILFYDLALVNVKIVVGEDCKNGSWPFGNSGCIKLLRAIMYSGICNWVGLHPQHDIAYTTAYSAAQAMKEHAILLFY